MNTLKFLTLIKNRKSYNKYVGKLVIYRITNLINKKCYIGITSRIKRRIYEHIRYCLTDEHPLISYIHNSIRKYGLENFSFEVIDIAKNYNDLNLKEEFYIDKYKSNNSNFGYNLTYGGNREVPNDITILKKIESSHKVKVAKYTKEGKFIESYNSVREAARKNMIPDTDIHRCHKNKWTRNGFMYRKFNTNPSLKINPYKSKKGENFKIKGKPAHNRIKCLLLNKKDDKIIFNANSFKELSEISGLSISCIDRLKNNPNHKKWKLIRNNADVPPVS